MRKPAAGCGSHEGKISGSTISSVGNLDTFCLAGMPVVLRFR
jgi:hypothetical protein